MFYFQDLLNELEAAQKDLSRLESENDDLKVANQSHQKEINVIKATNEEEIKALQFQLDESLGRKVSLEQIILHQREEIERLQAENAEEWGRRERSETEKQILDREIKKVKNQLEEQKERAKKLTLQGKEVTNSEMGRLQSQLDVHMKELHEIRLGHSRLRKIHAEKNEELMHFQRRSESSDKEVKVLRARIDELKLQLGRMEDENDEQANTIRRLQRTHEELLSQTEGYEVQIEHLTSRLRSMPSQAEQILGHRRPSRVSHLHMQHNYVDHQRVMESSSEESLPIFDDDEDINEIETDV